MKSGAKVISADISYEEPYRVVNPQLVETHLDISKPDDIERYAMYCSVKRESLTYW